MVHRYTAAQKLFIEQNVKGRPIKELTALFNLKYGTDLTYNQIRAFTKNYGLKNGIDSQFKPGHIPNNKDKKGITQGGVITQFKKGRLPYNYLPVGSERVNGDDYVDIKIADPNKWRGKHLLIWEEYHSKPVPKGYAVIFGDSNRRNFNPENLILVSRGQLLTMNRHGLVGNDTELTRSGVIVARLIEKISERKKKG